MASIEPTFTQTSDAKIWDKHLSAILQRASVDSVTAKDLAQSVFNHINTHVDRVIVEGTSTRQVNDLIYNTWEATTTQARADRNSHEKLIEFLREFWVLVEAQWPEIGMNKYYGLTWFIGDKARGGPCEPGAPCNPSRNYEEPHNCEDDESVPLNGTFAEKRASWLNFCRFAALLDRAGIINAYNVFSLTMQGVLRGETWPNYYPNLAVMGFEQVMVIAGDLLWERGGVWDTDLESIEGEELVELWKEWETTLKGISENEEREIGARESAKRVMALMKGVREKNGA